MIQGPRFIGVVHLIWRTLDLACESCAGCRTHEQEHRSRSYGQAPKRKGRPRTYELAKVAEAYSAAVARKDPAPLAAVVTAMPGLSRPYASKLVTQAADRGYLPEEYRPKSKGNR